MAKLCHTQPLEVDTLPDYEILFYTKRRDDLISRILTLQCRYSPYGDTTFQDGKFPKETFQFQKLTWPELPLQFSTPARLRYKTRSRRSRRRSSILPRPPRPNQRFLDLFFPNDRRLQQTRETRIGARQTDQSIRTDKEFQNRASRIS